MLFNGLFCAFAVVLSGIACMGSFSMSSSGIWYSGLYGIFFMLTVFLNLKAVEYGPLSATTLIVNLSLALPILYSCLFCGETLNGVRSIGLALLVACLVLFAEPGRKDTQTKKRSVIWLLLSVGAMLCNGFSSVFSKAYMEECGGDYAAQYVFWGYVAAAVASFVAYVFMNQGKKKESTGSHSLLTPAVLGLTVLISLFNFGGNFLVTQLATVIDGAVLYPFVQGGSIVVTTLISRVFLHEKLSLMKWLAIFAGVISVVLLSF